LRFGPGEVELEAPGAAADEGGLRHHAYLRRRALEIDRYVSGQQVLVWKTCKMLILRQGCKARELTLWAMEVVVV
jgi:hypothetical protein